MKARLIGAAALTVCATAVSESLADSPQKSIGAELRIAVELPHGRFADDRYLLTSRSTVGGPLSPLTESAWFGDRPLTLAAGVTPERPTGLIDELLFQQDRAWRLPAIRPSGFATLGPRLADWSGMTITSTVGE